MSIKQINDVKLGVYVWRLPNGEFLADEDFNVLSVTSYKNDLSKVKAINEAARGMGFEGNAVFLPGKRKISQTEFENQKERMAMGLVPDPYDMGVYKDGQ